jgi:hypothetical protein
MGLASCAGYFENTRVNFRIRDVWFNETDNMFYAYYDGSSLWKGHHYYVYLGKSPDPFFGISEFTYLYKAGYGWAAMGIYAPNVYFMENGQGLGAVKGHKNSGKPYGFDCDLIWIKKPSEIVFFSDPKGDSAYFEKLGQIETQATFIFEYNGFVYIYSRCKDPESSDQFGRLYEVRIN